MTTGMHTTIAINMIISVRWLETASHAVRLLAGCDEEGIRNGNIEKPAVSMTPVTLQPVATKAGTVRSDVASHAPIAAAPIPTAGARIVHGSEVLLTRHRTAAVSTWFSNGFAALATARIGM